ncbi:copper chaperone PCu(A)C [candidate division KSB1 bacterium]|nr:copper chaperone PCu(A)C [candidate division KSB1 bacterium]NIR72383.1 copper chaperone PCu(A)C [candidate division KSB1 bacterium]NIS23569.1 copper chaperone PCu(A)C [candidate division KSB1 bacterium]NIT70498.1 copper chaperone PCu(A)C [candidate division KSB1 bacterium]NIU24203.1 copper chaperone PCu(A)C [candidate division KSB1 bacterium]
MNKHVKSAVGKFSPLIGILLVYLLFLACQTSEPSFRGTEMAEDMPVMDLKLTNQNGEPFTLSEHRGKVVVLFFGYTYCPDVCPMTLSTWKKVQQELHDKAEQVEFVYVTVDPDRDTQERLAEHLAIFSSDFTGLTGTQEQLRKAYDSFGVYREKETISESAAGYLINHTARMNLIDRAGRWRLTFPHDAPVEDIVHDIRQLLQERSEMPNIQAENVWSRPAAKGGNGVVYLTLNNAGSTADRLLGAQSDICEVVEIHETKMQSDRMMMQPIEGGLEMPAENQIQFKPGGAHIMLIRLKKPLKVDESFEVVLQFEKSGFVSVVSVVHQP